MDLLFDSQGDNYHSRSVGMLEYDENNVMKKLERSFTFEPVSLRETG